MNPEINKTYELWQDAQPRNLVTCEEGMKNQSLPTNIQDTESDANWNYAALCATQDGFAIGSSAWMQRIRDLLPIIRDD